MDENQVNAKLLLYGEYSVIFDGDFLAVPIKKFGAQFVCAENLSPDQERSHTSLKKFFAAVSQQAALAKLFDEQKMQTACDSGIFLESTIPPSAGLGSSAAIVAATVKAFGTKDFDTFSLTQLQDIFGRLEDHFHSTSSGVDPLVCFTGLPIAKRSGTIEKCEIAKFLPEQASFFLFDTKTKRSTGTLVADLVHKLQQSAEKEKFEKEYMPLVSACIENVAAGDSDALWDAHKNLSYKQVEIFSPMIPDAVHDVWRTGLDAGTYAMKLAGAGGGGFFLGLTTDRNALQSDQTMKDRITFLTIGK